MVIWAMETRTRVFNLNPFTLILKMRWKELRNLKSSIRVWRRFRNCLVYKASSNLHRRVTINSSKHLSSRTALWDDNLTWIFILQLIHSSEKQDHNKTKRRKVLRKWGWETPSVSQINTCSNSSPCSHRETLTHSYFYCLSKKFVCRR